MLKRVALPIVALVVLLMLSSVPANGGVQFHVFVGPRIHTYPVYTYPYGYAYPYPRYYPYANYYLAPRYTHSYYTYTWHRRHELAEHHMRHRRR